MEKYFKQIGVGGLEINLREKELVNQVLDSNQLTYGQMTKNFESQFANLHDSDFGLFLNSGTSALQVALQALKISRGWQDGDEVLVPAVTFVATANIVIHNGMVPVFVDVDPKTYNMDAN
jgi:perosamine synthetase